MITRSETQTLRALRLTERATTDMIPGGMTSSNVSSKADINCSGMLSGLVNYMWGRGTRFIYYRAQHALADVAVQLVGLRWPTQSVPRSRFSPDLPGWLCWGFKKRSVLGSGGGNKNCCFS
jgi:hypothetical protein